MDKAQGPDALDAPPPRGQFGLAGFPVKFFWRVWMEILRIDGVFLRLAKTDGVTTRTGELCDNLQKSKDPPRISCWYQNLIFSHLWKGI